jgi:hypothetical protein
MPPDSRCTSIVITGHRPPNAEYINAIDTEGVVGDNPDKKISIKTNSGSIRVAWI